MDSQAPDSPPLSLGEIEEQLPVLEIACTCCGRRDRFYTERLVAWYGRDKGLLDLLRTWASACVWRDPVPRQTDCGAHFPGLERLRL